VLCFQERSHSHCDYDDAAPLSPAPPSKPVLSRTGVSGGRDFFDFLKVFTVAILVFVFLYFFSRCFFVLRIFVCFSLSVKTSGSAARQHSDEARQTLLRERKENMNVYVTFRDFVENIWCEYLYTVE